MKSLTAALMPTTHHITTDLARLCSAPAAPDRERSPVRSTSKLSSAVDCSSDQSAPSAPSDPPQIHWVATEVIAERRRQDSLVAAGKLHWNCANPAVDNLEKFAILSEEFGEVAQAMNNVRLHAGRNPNTGAPAHLRQELIQLAAVAVAWAESLPI